MKCLNAIFTYNRPALLQNCVDSYFEFGPEGDLLIVDDGSDMPQQTAYLAALARERGGQLAVWSSDRSNKHRLGGLYGNMQRVTGHAIQHGYDYVFYIQDDQQFMWKDPEFWNKVAGIFAAHPDTLVVRPVFDKKIFSHDHKNRFASCSDCAGVLFKKSWFTAVGIVSLRRAQELDWQFEKSEGENNNKSRDLGCPMYLLKHPTLAFVPTPETWRFGQKTAKTVARTKKYYFKPLSEAQVARILASDRVVLLEDYCIPWGWKAWAPYDFSDNRKKYLENLWRWMKKGKLRNWPRLQGTK